MTTSTDPAVVENPNRRVKVYVLGIDGQWDDRGTGYVSCEVLPVSMPDSGNRKIFRFRIKVFHDLIKKCVPKLSEVLVPHTGI